MESWKVVLICLGIIVLLAIIIAAIVVPIVLKKKKAKSQSSTVVKDTSSQVSQPEVIQLHAVKLEKGSGMFGYENYSELKERLSKLSKEEFKSLDLNEYPYTSEQWDKLSEDGEAVQKRNEYEMSIFFAYTPEKELKDNADILKREF